MYWTTVGNVLLIFLLRVTDVSLGTVRTMMIMRGMRKWAALTGFVEVTIWVVAVGRVIANLDSIWNVVGYSRGSPSAPCSGCGSRTSWRWAIHIST